MSRALNFYVHENNLLHLESHIFIGEGCHAGVLSIFERILIEIALDRAFGGLFKFFVVDFYLTHL